VLVDDAASGIIDSGPTMSRWQLVLSLVGLFIGTVVVAMILTSKSMVAWNSGPREQLTRELRLIGYGLADRDRTGSRTDPLAYLPRTAEHEAAVGIQEAERLLNSHGVKLKWYRSGKYQDIVFYPIAVSQSVSVDARSDAQPTPQIVMVPIEWADVLTLPNLCGCQRMSTAQLQACQLHRIEQLFFTLGIDDAATLMSDGSVRFIDVDELFTKLQLP